MQRGLANAAIPHIAVQGSRCHCCHICSCGEGSESSCKASQRPHSGASRVHPWLLRVAGHWPCLQVTPLPTHTHLSLIFSEHGNPCYALHQSNCDVSRASGAAKNLTLHKLTYLQFHSLDMLLLVSPLNTGKVFARRGLPLYGLPKSSFKNTGAQEL